MKASDIRAMTEDQIFDELVKLKKEQFNLRFQKASGQLENTMRVHEQFNKGNLILYNKAEKSAATIKA